MLRGILCGVRFIKVLFIHQLMH